MPYKTPEHDAIGSRAAAMHNRHGVNCAVCGRWKQAGSLLCHECMTPLPQSIRNRLGCSVEEFMEIVRDLRVERQAKELGLKVIS